MPSRETQQILIFESLILPAQGYNPRSTTLEASNRFGRVMVSVFAWSGVRAKPKTIKFGFCCFSSKHAALRRKSKDWLALNQDGQCVSSGVTCLSWTVASVS
jgi:hypothetical protein